MSVPAGFAGPIMSFLKKHCTLICVLLAVIFWFSVCKMSADYIAKVNKSSISEFSFASPDPKSESGYLAGMRNVILPASSVDGCQWIMHTQKMIANGDWRIRYTDIDQNPKGREIHWSSLVTWTMAIAGLLQSMVTGVTWAQGIAPAALWVNPVYLFLLLFTVPFATAKRFGALYGGIMAILMASAYPFIELFMYGAPDHHGLAVTGGLLTVFFATSAGGGWIALDGKNAPVRTGWFPVPFGRAKRDFIYSGAWAAFALWISAATAAPVFIGLGLATLFNAWQVGRSPKSKQAAFTSSLWSVWGSAAAIGSIFFYLLEYFPSHLGMRLEVNHPTYALAMWGGGQILHRIGDRLAEPGKKRTQAEALWLVAGIAATAVLPTVIFLAPERFFWVADKFLWLLHVTYIHEFKGLARLIAGNSLSTVLSSLSLIPLTFFGIVWMATRKDLGAQLKSILLLSAAPAMLLSFLGFKQVRWMNIATGLWFVPLVVFLFCLQFLDRKRFSTGLAKGIAVLLTIVFCGQYPQAFVRMAMQSNSSAGIGSADAVTVVMRDVAHQLRTRTGDKAPVVLSGPTTTTWLMYYGGAKGIGTLYWENVDGLKASAALNAATSADEAFQLVKKFGVTHIVVCAVDVFANEFTSLFRKAHSQNESVPAFLPNLLKTLSIPQWLLPLNYKSPDGTGEILVFEVHPEQTADVAYVGVGRYYRERGQLDKAILAFVEALTLNSNQPGVRIEYGMLLVRTQQVAEGMTEILRGVEALPAESRANTLADAARSLADARQYPAAIDLSEKALALSPSSNSFKNNLAWLLSASPDAANRNGPRALELARQVTATEQQASYLHTLAAALAETGDFPASIQAAQRGASAASATGQNALAQQISKAIPILSANQTLRLPAPTPPPTPAPSPKKQAP